MDTWKWRDDIVIMMMFLILLLPLHSWYNPATNGTSPIMYNVLLYIGRLRVNDDNGSAEKQYQQQGSISVDNYACILWSLAGDCVSLSFRCIGWRDRIVREIYRNCVLQCATLCFSLLLSVGVFGKFQRIKRFGTLLAGYKAKRTKHETWNVETYIVPQGTTLRTRKMALLAMSILDR